MSGGYVHRINQLVCVALVLVLAVVLGGCGSSEPESATIVVRSTPDGAYIMVDGTDYGTTPVTIPDLALGEHYVILMHPEHRRLNKRIALESPETFEFDLEMERFSGEVKFLSRPPGAQVTIFQQSGPAIVGVTPLDKVKIDTGIYTFEYSLENYRFEQGELVVDEGGYYVKDLTLKAKEAKLQLFSRPTEAKIFINDELRVETTPATITLLPGEYGVGVYVEGHNIHEEIVNLRPNDNKRVDAVLRPGNMPLGMVLVPAGEFIFGEDDKSPDEKPRIKINLPAFYMDKYEVTNAQFKEVFPSHIVEDGLDNFPVQGVSWRQADEYARAVGKRLPTEKEWEKAARGTQGREYSWGIIFKKENLNYLEIGAETKKVGTYRKGVSEFGCYDMAGNVYEWVSDWYNPYPNNPDVKIEYGTVYKVLRGGSYQSDSFEVRSARRHYNKPDNKREDYGFRCAMDIQ